MNNETAGSITTSCAVFQIQYSAPEGLTFLSWDTKGTGREQTNLLRASSTVQLWQIAGDGTETPVPFIEPDTPPPAEPFWWTVDQEAGRLSFRISQPANTTARLHFPLNPGATPVTLVPAGVTAGSALLFPAILSAPDFGQLSVSSSSVASIQAQLPGDRSTDTVDLFLELVTEDAEEILLDLDPLVLEASCLAPDDPFWLQARHGWFDVFQPTSQWGQQDTYYSAPVAVLGNNVISDPCSFALWTYADAAFWTPEPVPGISLMQLVRRTLDWWLDSRTNSSGECAGYWATTGFQDANPSLLISAWDYVESTGDLTWLEQRIGALESLNAFIVSRDVDGDGLVEAQQPGTPNGLQQPDRSCAWWDALNCGYKDGFSNALTYRAWRCLADLEARLGRTEQSQACTQLADRLKAAYRTVLWNSSTGWLGWWRDQSGTLHDYASPVVNALAIEYGLVDAATAADILARLRARAADAGFDRPDLGIPSFLTPVHRSDYLQPNGLGCPTLEDGTDTFGQYMNGGISASASLHWIMAHYLVGETEYADSFLSAMLARQNTTGFQNGVVNVFPKGIDWTNWQGEPCGYEGYLSDNYRFLQAVMLRQPELRERFYRPLGPWGA